MTNTVPNAGDSCYLWFDSRMQHLQPEQHEVFPEANIIQSFWRGDCLGRIHHPQLLRQRLQRLARKDFELKAVAKRTHTLLASGE